VNRPPQHGSNVTLHCLSCRAQWKADVQSLACKTWVQATKNLSVHRGQDKKEVTKATECIFTKAAQKLNVFKKKWS